MEIGKIYQPEIKTSKNSYEITLKIKSDYGNVFFLKLKIKNTLYIDEEPNAKTIIKIVKNMVIPKDITFVSASKLSEIIGKKVTSRYIKTNNELTIYIPMRNNSKNEYKLAYLNVELMLQDKKELLNIKFEWGE